MNSQREADTNWRISIFYAMEFLVATSLSVLTSFSVTRSMMLVVFSHSMHHSMNGAFYREVVRTRKKKLFGFNAIDGDLTCLFWYIRAACYTIRQPGEPGQPLRHIEVEISSDVFAII